MDFHSGTGTVYSADIRSIMAVGVLGGKRGTLAILVYVLLGAVGVPVFAGFSGGIGALLGNAGGYIVGFIFSALLCGQLSTFLAESRSFRSFLWSLD